MSQQTPGPRDGFQVQGFLGRKEVTASFEASKETKELAEDKTVDLKELAEVSAETAVKYEKAIDPDNEFIIVDADTGMITLKKGLKVGAYKVSVKLMAPEDEAHEAADARTIMLTVDIKTPS